MIKNATFEETVATIFSGQTAIFFLDKLKIAENAKLKILIAGATGLVGAASIQITRQYKADINAVCSPEGRKIVSELGVNSIVLYDKEDFTKQTEKFDIIFDAVGKFNKTMSNSLEKNWIYTSVNSVSDSETL